MFYRFIFDNKFRKQFRIIQNLFDNMSINRKNNYNYQLNIKLIVNDD